MPDPLYWLLEYPDGTGRAEMADNTSVYDNPPGAVRLHASRPDGTIVCGVDLKGNRPVWYRIRGLTFNVEDAPSLEATVFGWVDPTTLDFELHAAFDGRVQPCPDQFLDPAAVALAAGRP